LEDKEHYQGTKKLLIEIELDRLGPEAILEPII
jgi:hypothetical protein